MLFTPKEVFLFLRKKYGNKTSDFLFYHNILEKIMIKPKNLSKNTVIIPICIDFGSISHMCVLLKTSENKIYYINPNAENYELPFLIKNFVIENVEWNLDNLQYITTGKKYECINSCLYHIALLLNKI